MIEKYMIQGLYNGILEHGKCHILVDTQNPKYVGDEGNGVAQTWNITPAGVKYIEFHDEALEFVCRKNGSDHYVYVPYTAIGYMYCHEQRDICFPVYMLPTGNNEIEYIEMSKSEPKKTINRGVSNWRLRLVNDSDVQGDAPIGIPNWKPTVDN